MDVFLDKSVKDFEKCHDIADGYIPVELQDFLNTSGSDSKFREVWGMSDITWQCISKCVILAMESKDNGFWRYLNGLILIARNLVTTKGAGALAWSEGTGLQILLLIQRLLGKTGALKPGQEKILNTSFQFLANMSSEAVSSKTSIPALHVVLDQYDNTQMRNYCRQLANDDNAKPILIFLETAVAHNPETMIPLLVESSNGRTLFLEILTHTELWHSQELDDYAVLVNRIVRHILQVGYGPKYLDSFIKVASPDQFLSLLKLFDAAVSSLDQDETEAGLPVEIHWQLAAAYNKQLEYEVTKSVPYITQVGTANFQRHNQAWKLELRNAWNSLVMVLDTLNLLLENVEIRRKLLSKEDRDVIKLLVRLLGEAQKTLPRRGKLAEISDDTLEVIPEEFPYIKGKIISLLSLLTMHDRGVQDEIREHQGLELVLSNCMIDRNNPFIRERAILCIRYLLEDNVENQTIVAKLEAKEPVSEQAVEDAGYETEMVDGQVRLKKRKT